MHLALPNTRIARAISILLFTLLLHPHLGAQSDTLLERILKTRNDSVKVKLLNDKVWELMFSEKVRSLQMAEKALVLAERSQNLNSLSDSYNTLGSYYIITSNFRKAIEFHQKALTIRTKLNDRKGLMKTYNNLGSAYKYLGAHKKELEYYFLALKMSEEFRDTLVQTAIINNIADAFGRQDNYDKAIEYNNRALEMRLKQNDPKRIASSQINLGTMYLKKKNFGESEMHFKKAEKIIETVKDNYLQALFHSNYAAFLKDVSRFDEAVSHITRSIQLHEAIGNANGNLVNYINIAAIKEAQKKFSESNRAYQKALELSTAVGNLLWEKQSYLGLSTTFSQLQNFKDAYTYQLKYEKLKDSLSNSDLKARVEELQQRYNNDQLVHQNQLLERVNLIKQLESDQKGYVITFLVSLFLVAVMAFLLFWRNYRYKQLLKLKQITAEAEENERQRIAKDIHDELGSGLTKIRFMSELLKNKSADKGTASIISETANSLVENMRDLIWVMNPENVTLDNLISRMREYSGQYTEDFNIEFDFFAPSFIPDIKTKKELNRNTFMIVKEALQNIVKHSDATKASIRIDIQKDLLIEVYDNGSGKAEQGKEGNGIRNMQQRAGLLKGSFELVSGDGKGTLIKVSIPL